jgi:CMP/dCMP kinase
LIDLGVDVSYEEILEQQNARDQQDTERESGGLKPAPDSITVWTDGMNEEEVLRRLVGIVESKRANHEASDAGSQASLLLRSS